MEDFVAATAEVGVVADTRVEEEVEILVAEVVVGDVDHLNSKAETAKASSHHTVFAVLMLEVDNAPVALLAGELN